MHDLPEKIDSKFRFVLLAAQRAEQMMRAIPRQGETQRDAVTRIAMREILADEIAWDYGASPVDDEGDEVAELLEGTSATEESDGDGESPPAS